MGGTLADASVLARPALSPAQRTLPKDPAPSSHSLPSGRLQITSSAGLIRQLLAKGLCDASPLPALTVFQLLSSQPQWSVRRGRLHSMMMNGRGQH